MMESLDWGVVSIVRGRHKGRIGYFDCDDDRGHKAIVFFGHPLITRSYVSLSHASLAPATTSDLVTRFEKIFSLVNIAGKLESDTTRSELLTELSLIENELQERSVVAENSSIHPKKVFISHSSLDKQFAILLSTDLATYGYDPWLDEWKIKVGESIPVKISEGLNECQALIVILSENSVRSRWVENEWQAKYWDELQSPEVIVLPVMLGECEIPILLKTKKYADFSQNYNSGLTNLLEALRS